MPATPVEEPRDLVGYAGAPPDVAWPGGSRLAVSVAVDFEEGAERNLLEGDALSEAGDPESVSEGAVGEPGLRSLQAESIWEYGPRAGAWRLLRILRRHRVVATFFCAGQALERNPVLAEQILVHGHEMAGRGYRLQPYYSLSEVDERADISKAVEVIRTIAGGPPAGWRSRAASVRTRRLLVEAGTFTYDSDFAGDDVPVLARSLSQRFVKVPHPVETSDAGYWAMTGTSGFTRPSDLGDVLIRAFDQLHLESRARPRMMSVGLRLRVSGRPSRAGQLDRFLRHARGAPGVWFARRDQLAEWWLDHASSGGDG